MIQIKGEKSVNVCQNYRYVLENAGKLNFIDSLFTYAIHLFTYAIHLKSTSFPFNPSLFLAFPNFLRS